jgi:hypothetical protein
VDVEPELLKSEVRGGVEGVFELGEKSLVILHPHYRRSLLRASGKHADTP